MTDNFVVAVEAVEGALEGVGEHQAANEVANGDLAILQLGLKVDVPICFEGVEEDLPVGGFHDGVEIVPIVCDLQGVGPGSLIGADTEIRNTSPQRVLGDRCVLQKRNGHATTTSTVGDRRSAGSCPLQQLLQRLHAVILALSISAYQPKGARAAPFEAIAGLV